jgi:hypothetical protein
MAQGDLFDLYFTYVKDTESPVIFHRWSLIAAVGAFLGRTVWLPFGASRIFPNQYIMLIGNPGSRKSAAIKGVRRVISAAGYSTFAAEKTSKEKFLVDLQGESDGSDTASSINIFRDGASVGDEKQVFITADEFNEFVGSGNLEFLSMLGALWDWDDPETPYKSRTKTAKSVGIYQPTISILAGNTHAGFAEAFPLAVLGQGFMSRLVLIYSEPSGRRITIPPVPNAELLTEMVRELGRIKDACVGELSYSKQAYSALDSIYKTWEDLEDTRFKHYSTRRFTHLLKLCIIVTAIAKRHEILVEDVLLSNTILTFAETNMPKAMGELGRKRSSDVSSILMQLLYDTRTPLTVLDLWRHLEKELDRMEDLSRMLMNLDAAGKVQKIKRGDGHMGFLSKQNVSMKHKLYVDFNLLKGKEL